MSTTGSVVLDTSILIAHLRGESEVAVRLSEAGALFVPWVVAGELHYGAKRALRQEEQLRMVRDLLRGMILLLPDEGTSELYGTVKANLAAAGRPIPENDIWIATIALQYGLPLATRDGHFEAVAGLNTLDW
ncbi:MAG: type II toxin-antitoxin system VapC family toxin [Bryobacteraceae bacterium]|nr:type II toxin-antitoxin system VapC family toxin [Bryobacteraceae bacterium]